MQEAQRFWRRKEVPGLAVNENSSLRSWFTALDLHKLSASSFFVSSSFSSFSPFSSFSSSSSFSLSSSLLHPGGVMGRQEFTSSHPAQTPSLAI